MTITPLLGSSESEENLSEDGFVILKASGALHPNAIVAPDQFTLEQYAELRTENATVEGAYTLTLINPDLFTSLQPSSLRVLTSTDASVSARVSKATSYVDTTTTPPTLVAGYQLNGFYRSSASSEFDVRSNVPIHGDDHLVTPGAVLYINVLEPLYEGGENIVKLMGLLGGKFIRDTEGHHEHRLNQNVKSLLLIIAQQEGEDISALSAKARQARSSEIFYVLLDKCGLKLKSNFDSLGIPVYERMVTGLLNRIFYNAGIETTERPLLNEIYQGIFLSQAEREQNPATEGVKYLVPFKALPADRVIRKDISTLHAPLPRLKGLGDQRLVQLERAYQANRFTFPTEALAGFPVEAQNSVLWTVMRWGVLDPLEREAVAQMTGFMATKMGEHMPYGQVVCHGLLGLSKVLGRKRVADLAVDTAHGFIQPREIIEEGFFSGKGLGALDKSAECLIGLLPFGGIAYGGGKVLVRLAGYESPVHMVRGKQTLTNGEIAEHTDRVLHGTAETLRQGVKMIIPGGALLVGAAGGIAWYLEADSLTHYAHGRLTSSSDDASASSSRDSEEE